MFDRNNTFTSVSENVHTDNSPEQCTLLAQLFAKPITIVRKWNVPVPMAEQDLFGSQEYAPLDPLTEGTFLVKTLGQWVGNKPTIRTNHWRWEGL
jgi:hypothetical protein